MISFTWHLKAKVIYCVIEQDLLLKEELTAAQHKQGF